MYNILYLATIIQLGLGGGATAGVVIAVLLVVIVLTLLGIYLGYKYYDKKIRHR